MRNEQYKLTDSIPRDVRLSTYKIALQYYRACIAKRTDKMWSKGLCIVIPCALWDLHDWSSKGANDYDWNYHDVSISFPELKDGIDELNYCDKGNTYKMRRRRDILKAVIKTMEDEDRQTKEKEES